MEDKIDLYFSNSQKWQKELELLREIVLECGLIEVMKWMCPCYTYQKSNVVLIHEFKDYCALLFFKGALMHDEEVILIQQTENVQAARQIRFTSVKEILDLKDTLRTYIYEAIEIEKAGLKVELKKVDEFQICDELHSKLNENEGFKLAFEKLTIGRQKAYNMHFAEAKQTATRIARIEKYIPRILIGKGLTDCVCGLSIRLPNCDGSHKMLKEKK